MSAKVIEKGRAVVPARVFINVLKSFPESKVSVELNLNTNQLKVQCEKSIFNLNTFAIDEYTQFPQIKEKIKLLIDFGTVKKLVNKSIKAASTEESRTILTGVLTAFEKNPLNEEANETSPDLSYIKMVGTDSYRLAYVEEKINYSGEPIRVVVPNNVLDNITKVITRAS